MVALIFQNQQEIEKDGQRGYTLFISFQVYLDYILCSQRWESSIQSAKTRPATTCGSDHELLIAKFRLKLKKVRKTTRRK